MDKGRGNNFGYQMGMGTIVSTWVWVLNGYQTTSMGTKVGMGTRIRVALLTGQKGFCPQSG